MLTATDISKSENGTDNNQAIPTFLRDDYPYKPADCENLCIDNIETDSVYEIKCLSCEMCIRAQGAKINTIYEQIRDKGCINCGSDFVFHKITMLK